MAYVTNLKFSERSGLGIRVVDENVGTGDNSETSFDLDNINITSGSYSLYHAASGSNSMTALTETTHYTLDKESGRVVLETAGKTALGTDILYATYWYTDSFSDSVITQLITAADDEIDKWTGRKWDTATTTTEYYDGKPTLPYPHTDRPYVSDYDKPDGIRLLQSPVTAINGVYFLQQPLDISEFWNYDAGTAAYTEKTDEVNSITESPFTAWDDAPATNDYIYIGCSNVFLGLDVTLSTLGVDNGSTAVDWEYYNGSSWTDITETDVDTGASILTASGRFTWTYPYGWAKTQVNSGDSLYFIRGKLTDDYSTDPIVATMTVYDGVNEPIEKRNVILKDNTVFFTGKSIPHGVRNVRVDYSYGQATTPTYIEELSLRIAALQAFINLSGGSYDDATSYTLGSKSVTIGEVYVNIREVLSQIQKRIDELYKLVGKRVGIAVI
jgi:hypothetical protein